MGALGIGETSDCSNPVLDLYTQVDGLLFDVYSVEYQVWRRSGSAPAQVFPATAGERTSVDLAPCPGGDRLGLGHYVATWTAAGTACRYEVRWFVKTTETASEQAYCEEFDVLAQPVAFGQQEPYALIADLRAEGVPLSQASDARAFELLLRASETIERVCGLWFQPRALAMLLDGPGTQTLFLRVPICGIESIAIDGDEIAFTSVAVYARHLSQRLLSPDDRRNPQLVRKSCGDTWRGRGPVWPRGLQNLAISGVFGFTEPTAATCMVGTVPRAVRLACVRLAVLELELLASPDRGASRRQGDITSEGTRDQRVTYGDRQSSSGIARVVPAYGSTGDAEVDAMLGRFRPPIHMAVT